MRHGAATENAVDLEVAGPLGPWRYTRSYSSTDGVRNTQSSQGWGWLNNQSERRLKALDTVNYNKIGLIERGDSQIDFSRASSSAPFIAAGTDWRLTHDTGNQQYIIANPRTGEEWLFNDFTVATGKGRLKEVTTTWWRGDGKTGSIITHNSYGYVTQITTPQGQSHNITFSYSSANRIGLIQVKKGSTVLMKAEYTYFKSTLHHADVGSDGDLIQVKVTQLVTGGTDITNASHVVERYTQYRYDSDSRLEAIFNHDGIYSLVADNTGDAITSPNSILAQSDTYATGTGTHQVKDFADRLYTYYTSNYSTSSADTAFTPGSNTENLETTYNAANTNETGMVMQGIDRPTGCASCGSGSATGVKYDYYYMARDTHGTSPGYDDVVWVVVEDVSDSNNTAVKRRVWGLNNWGHILRQVTIKNPLGTAQYWCSSRTFNVAGLITEYRLHSAHTDVDSESEVKEFLDPSTLTASVLNDSRTLNDGSGFIWSYDYDTNGRRTWSKIRRGETGTAYYESYIEYYGTTNLAKRIRSYPALVTSETDPPTGGVYTEYEYTFWDTAQLRIKTRNIILPSVGTDQNGSGAAAALRDLWEYYDEAGRLRWTKNGEGYVTYRAYNPSTGSLAYQMRDVDTSNITGEIADGSTGKWEAWSGAVPSDLVRDTGLPTALKLITKNEYDDLGRLTLRIYPRLNRTYLRYEKYRTITFPYVDAASGMPKAPVIVTVWDDAHRNTEVYAVDPATTTPTNGVPTGLNATQANYVSWTRNHYDSFSGALTKVDQYHKILDSGLGALGTDFYSTSFLHTPMGHLGATIEYVDTNKFQVTTTLYNMHDRPVEQRHGVATAVPTSYAALVAALGGSPPTNFLGYENVVDIEYDNDGVGDGYITSIKTYHGSGSNDYTQTVLHRTFRGHIRGIERRSSSGDITPYVVMDLNWLGETTGRAQYTTEPNWTGQVLAGVGYIDYIAGSTSPHDRTETFYDNLGRVFRTEHYPGTSSNKLRTNSYYDRRDLLVSSGDAHSDLTEYEYDGVGRQVAHNVVKEISSPTYSSGKFQYSASLIERTWSQFDASGNPTVENVYEVNHDSSYMILDTETETDYTYVRHSSAMWYDGADRLITTAYWGSGNDEAGDTWSRVEPDPGRPTVTDPTTLTSNAERLITQHAYDSASGRPSVTTDPKGTKSKDFYDDFGRRIFVSENYDNFTMSLSSPPGTGLGDTSDKSKDRVTRWEYNGVGQLIKLTAYNSDGTSNNPQETEYQYTDIYDASLVRLTKYPDGNTDTTGGNQDNVQLTYDLDGAVKTRKDQRGVVLTYTYDSARRLIRQGATTIPTSVHGGSSETDAVRAISRTYDTLLGQIEKITSYADADGTGPVQNEIKYTYHPTLGYLQKTEQSHQGVVGVGTPVVEYARDDAATSGLYTSGLRQKMVTYPSGRKLHQTYGTAGSTSDVLDRIDMLEEDSGGAPGADLVKYSYNGTGRLVLADYPQPDVVLSRSGTIPGDYPKLDRFGRIKDQHWYDYTGGTVDLVHIKHGYDAASNRIWREDVLAAAQATPVHQDELYAYDGLHRLKNMQRGDLTSTPSINGRNYEHDWALDQLGNWSTFKERYTGSTWAIDQTRYHNAVNEIDGNGGNSIAGTPNWADPAHDAAGNMTTMPQPLAPTSSFALKYDAWNRLITVHDGSNNLVQQNEYDGLGRRIVRVDAVPSTDVTYDCYYNEKWQLLEERKNGSANPLQQFVWHPYYVDALAVRYYDGNTDGDYLGTNEGAHYYCHDGNFNVVAIANSSGSVLERYRYLPYGAVRVQQANFANQSGSQNSTNIGNTHFYTGRERDAETGLQLNRNRYYAPHLGRWVNRDPIGYEGGTPNLYDYVGAMPISHFDPYGLIKPDPGWSGFIEEQTNLHPSPARPKRDPHKCRNDNNRCPRKKPNWRGEDYLGWCGWIDEGISNFWHGGYHCFRARPGGICAGSQCCYDSSGSLVTSGPYQGTYDYSPPQSYNSPFRYSIPKLIGHCFHDVLPGLYDWDYEDDCTNVY